MLQLFIFVYVPGMLFGLSIPDIEFTLLGLEIELTSPLFGEMSETDAEINERYISALERVRRINMALIGYGSSAFAQRLGRNFVRPPIIRTNAILRNKNLRECLTLWEYIEIGRAHV